jgi:hypothetical protein
MDPFSKRPRRRRVRKIGIEQVPPKNFFQRETTKEDLELIKGFQEREEKAIELERQQQENEIALEKQQLEIEGQKLKNKGLEQEIANQKEKFVQKLKHEIVVIKILGYVLVALTIVFTISAIFTGSVVLLAGFNVSGFQLETSTINLLIGVTIAEVAGLIVTLLGIWLRVLGISNNKE